jgi:hypothetical protein
MKYHCHDFNPSGVPVDRSRNYMGSDGRWVLLVPLSLLIGALVVWSFVGASVIEPRDADTQQQVRLSGYQTTSNAGR